MIIISREEAMTMRAKFGDDANISITNRHKKGGRKKYYLPEEGKLMAFLNRLRNKQQKRNSDVNTRRGDGGYKGGMHGYGRKARRY